MTFSPFVRGQVERAAITAQSKTLSDVSKEVTASLEAQQSAMTDVRGELDSMLKSKKADFGALQRAVELTRQSPGTGPGASTDRTDRTGARPMVQMPMLGVQRRSARLEESARAGFFVELIQREGISEEVRAANTGRKLRIALRLIVEQHVITPRFKKVSESWQAKLPVLREKAVRVKARFAEMAKIFPDEPLWTMMPAEVERYVAALQEVTFRPPDDPEWWHTVVGKDDAVLRMKNVAVELISSKSFRTATEALQKLLNDRKQVVAALDARLLDLQRRFEEQQDRLSDLIAPIKGVALDLSIVVGNFPLVLSILLGIATIWPARRYGELFRAATVARRADLIDELAADVLWRSRDWGRSVTHTLGLVALFIAWVLAAAWQLSAWPGRDGLDLVIMTATSVLIVVASGLYKAQTTRAATSSR